MVGNPDRYNSSLQQPTAERRTRRQWVVRNTVPAGARHGGPPGVFLELHAVSDAEQRAWCGFDTMATLHLLQTRSPDF